VISGSTRVAGVIGSPVRHSLSPAIMNAAFDALGVDWRFFAFEVPGGGAAAALAAMRALGLGGLSVTMPHKEAVAGLVDRCSSDAEQLRAVNCVVPSGDLLVGENTDGPGFCDALRNDLDLEPAGLRVAVLGAGGAARAVVLALGRAGAAEVVVVNRTPANAERCAALAPGTGRVGTAAAALERADLVVNATSVGMGGTGLPLDPSLLQAGHAVVDLVYHPTVTPLLAAAAAKGCRTAGGLGMLVYQAVHAVRHWTGLEPPVEAMAAAARAALADRETD